jgi:antitoxin PrlF
MQIAGITAKGQMTIPVSILKAAHMETGDILVFEIEDDHLIVKKITFPANADLNYSREMLNEWSSPEDEKAWKRL